MKINVIYIHIRYIFFQINVLLYITFQIMVFILRQNTIKLKHMNQFFVIPCRVDSRVWSPFSFIFLFFFLKFRLKLIRFVLCSSPLFKNRLCRSSCASAMTSNRLSFSPPRASLIKPQPFSLCSHCSVENAHALQYTYLCLYVLRFTASK